MGLNHIKANWSYRNRSWTCLWSYRQDWEGNKCGVTKATVLLNLRPMITIFFTYIFLTSGTFLVNWRWRNFNLQRSDNADRTNCPTLWKRCDPFDSLGNIPLLRLPYWQQHHNLKRKACKNHEILNCEKTNYEVNEAGGSL